MPSTPTRLWPALLSALLALALLAPSASAQSDDTPTDSGSSSSNGKVVLAYYYTWWEPERISDSLFTPSALPAAQQLSGDTALLRKHMQEAKAAGVDGWIVNRVSDLPLLLPLARDAHFTVTLQLDGNQDFEPQLAGFYQYVNDPAMVRYQGHAVLFFWQAGALPAGEVQAERDAVDPNHAVIWIADGDNFNILRVDAFDGISPYAIAWSANPRGQLVSWASKAHASGPDKLYIPPVSPGCDDHLVRAATCVRDRGDGSYYDAAWQGALDSGAPWAVVVSTWNEWLEATQIEPSVQYGDEYLQMTKQYADAFKSN